MKWSYTAVFNGNCVACCGCHGFGLLLRAPTLQPGSPRASLSTWEQSVRRPTNGPIARETGDHMEACQHISMKNCIKCDQSATQDSGITLKGEIRLNLLPKLCQIYCYICWQVCKCAQDLQLARIAACSVALFVSIISCTFARF